ncbi:unnamed protein product [[Candida] boidinii]|nr:unnamed protein product [[Candida] boidinii]
MGAPPQEPFSPLFKESYSTRPDDVGSIESINSISVPEPTHLTNASNTNTNINPVKSILKRPTILNSTDDSKLTNIDNIIESSSSEAKIRRRKPVPVKQKLSETISVFKPTDNKGSTARDQLANEPMTPVFQTDVGSGVSVLEDDVIVSVDVDVVDVEEEDDDDDEEDDDDDEEEEDGRVVVTSLLSRFFNSF